MNIVVTQDNTGFAPRTCRYSAVDDDTYDGAPDSRNRGMVGYGATPEEAIADWHRLHAEMDEMDDEYRQEMPGDTP